MKEATYSSSDMFVPDVELVREDERTNAIMYHGFVVTKKGVVGCNLKGSRSNWTTTLFHSRNGVLIERSYEWRLSDEELISESEKFWSLG